MKVIEMNTPDGQHTLPLIKVAEHKASYYYNSKDEPLSWKEEVEAVMNDDYEGIDWLLNSTDYEDWEDETTKINGDIKVLMNDFWSSSDDFKIIEVEDDGGIKNPIPDRLLKATQGMAYHLKGYNKCFEEVKKYSEDLNAE